jgi:hypothetical protein
MTEIPHRLGAPANPLARLIPWKINQHHIVKELDWIPNHRDWYVPTEDTPTSCRQKLVRDEVLRQCDGDDGVSIKCPMSPFPLLTGEDCQVIDGIISNPEVCQYVLRRPSS